MWSLDRHEIAIGGRKVSAESEGADLLAEGCPTTKPRRPPRTGRAGCDVRFHAVVETAGIVE